MFIVGMWALLLLGGGVVVAVLGPITVTGYGGYNMMLSSIIKGVIAVGLAVIWVVILVKMKNWIFRKTFAH